MPSLSPASIPNARPAPTTPAPRALIERQMARLERLADIGMEIAEAAGRRAVALADGAATDAEAAEPALSFSRAARAVRLTIALQQKLAEALAALERGEAAVRQEQVSRRRMRVRRIVEEAVEAEARDTNELRRLLSEASERLTDEDESVLLDAPTHEVVARICRDLGVPFDPALWPPPFPPASARAGQGGRGAVAPGPGPGRGAREGGTAGDDDPPQVEQTPLQREQRENRNEPGTGLSERVRQ